MDLVERHASARYLVGSSTTNPGMYLGMRMRRERALFVGSAQRRVW